MSKRVGVYICHCGTNIDGKVDVEKISEEIGAEGGEVVVCRHYKYMCSEPGQKLIRDDVVELKLDHVVEASCSPKMHEPTFRNCVSQAGMNQYMFEMVNIREHCSWVTESRDLATLKAKSLIKGGIERVKHHRPLVGSKKPVTRQALVVGGGIAGITSALKIARSGYKVFMVEKEEIIGGRMAQFDKTFPTLDCAACILTPKMVAVGKHPNIHLITWAEVEAVSGRQFVEQVCGAVNAHGISGLLHGTHDVYNHPLVAVESEGSLQHDGDPLGYIAAQRIVDVQGYEIGFKGY